MSGVGLIADTRAVHGRIFTEARLIGPSGGLYDWLLYSWRFCESRRLEPMEDGRDRAQAERCR